MTDAEQPGGGAGRSRPSVSVVVATRDRPELVREALASIVGQEYDGEIECLVVHDRCDPDTRLEAMSRPGRPVRVLTNVRTPGLPGARNSGLLQAHGELLAFCDDDDTWMPDKIARQVDRLAETGADVCTAGVLVDFDGKHMLRVPTTPEVEHRDLLRRRVLEASHPSTYLVRRSALDRIGLVDEAIPGGYGEDYDWILRAAQHGRVVTVPAALARVRWGRTSFFSQRWKMISDSTDYMLAKHPQLSQDRRGLAEHLGRKAFALAAQGDNRGAWASARRSLASNRSERRAYLALALTCRVVKANTVMRLLNAAGKGL